MEESTTNVEIDTTAKKTKKGRSPAQIEASRIAFAKLQEKRKQLAEEKEKTVNERLEKTIDKKIEKVVEKEAEKAVKQVEEEEAPSEKIPTVKEVLQKIVTKSYKKAEEKQEEKPIKEREREKGRRRIIIEDSDSDSETELVIKRRKPKKVVINEPERPMKKNEVIPVIEPVKTPTANVPTAPSRPSQMDILRNMLRK